MLFGAYREGLLLNVLCTTWLPRVGMGILAMATDPATLWKSTCHIVDTQYFSACLHGFHAAAETRAPSLFPMVNIERRSPAKAGRVVSSSSGPNHPSAAWSDGGTSLRPALIWAGKVGQLISSLEGAQLNIIVMFLSSSRSL